MRHDFAATAPNRLWAAGITYEPISAGILLKTAMLDAPADSSSIERWPINSVLHRSSDPSTWRFCHGSQRSASFIRPTKIVSQRAMTADGVRETWARRLDAESRQLFAKCHR